MCGIVGYVSDNKPNKQIIKKMTDKIAHRGPDGEGFYLDDNCALGHRRLSIVDLKTGSQPIYNEDKTKIIIYNGQVYNFKELKKELSEYKFTTKTDTEVILHGYEKWGKDIVKRLRGMFAFAIWDKTKKELFLARDSWGIKPLYYYQNNNTFMFASEIKAFLEHPDFIKKFNENILASYLCFNSTPTVETFFKGVYRVKPGYIVTYKNGITKEECFKKLVFKETEEPLEKVVQKISEAMKESLKYHQISDVEIASFLSSGIDSSYIVALSNVNKTYTVGFNDSKYDEISYAKDLAKKLGIENKSMIINEKEYLKALPDIMYYMDEPLADPSGVSLYFASKLASKDVKVVMSGEGADELFGGYNSYQEELSQSWYMKIPFVFRNMISKIVSFLPDVRGLNFLYRRGMHLKDYHIGIGRIFRDKEALSIVNNKEQIKPTEIIAPLYEEYKNNSTLVQRQVIDYYFWLVNDFLHVVDRNTMMFGLEARTPYLDDAVFSVASRLSLENKISKTQTKIALRKAAKEVIPTDAYKKRKLGFPVPLRKWMQNDNLYNQIKEVFESSTAKKYFNQKKIMKLLNKHKEGKKDCYKKVWTIYVFLIWYKKYFD